MLVVARIGVGYDAVDVPALTEKKIPLMVAGTANSPSVAEQAMFMMMTLAKRGAELNAMVQDNQWGKRMSAVPVDLFDKTVLVVGFGRIGTRSAKRCQAMEMKVLVFDPYKSAGRRSRRPAASRSTDLDAALPSADFVTIHCPKTPETVGMFNAARLASMKPTAYLVNTARGGIIDEPALHDALTTARSPAPASTCSSRSRPRPDNPLLKLANVLSAPHMAGVTTRIARPHGPAVRAEHPDRARRQADPRERRQQGSAGLTNREDTQWNCE